MVLYKSYVNIQRTIANQLDTNSVAEMCLRQPLNKFAADVVLMLSLEHVSVEILPRRVASLLIPINVPLLFVLPLWTGDRQCDVAQLVAPYFGK